MSTADITLTIFILWIFGCIHGFNKLMGNVNKIKKNWPDYRCKPVIMPFANVLGPEETSTTENFNWCIQNVGQVFAGNSLSSLSPGFDATASGLANAGTGLDVIGQSMKGLKSNSKKNSGSTFDIFGNIIMKAKKTVKSVHGGMNTVKAGGGVVQKTFTSAMKGIVSGFEHVMHAIKQVPKL